MSQTKVEAPFVENNRPFRNLFINGDMSIAQRATSATGLTGSSYPTICLLYTSPSPRDPKTSRMPSSA